VGLSEDGVQENAEGEMSELVKEHKIWIRINGEWVDSGETIITNEAMLKLIKNGEILREALTKMLFVNCEVEGHVWDRTRWFQRYKCLRCKTKTWFPWEPIESEDYESVIHKTIPDYDLPWSSWPWNRCKAYRERRWYFAYYGRCDLIRYHDCDHALDRGMEILRWSTRWTE
jgi:hypothetical protein